MDKKEWLNALKVGDQVAMDKGNYGYRNYCVTTITKITPTRRIETANGYQFDNNGCERGKKTTWDKRKYLEPVTQTILDHVETIELLEIIRKSNFSKLPLEKLRGISEILK